MNTRISISVDEFAEGHLPSNGEVVYVRIATLPLQRAVVTYVDLSTGIVWLSYDS
jgi:hypothetical protein